MCRSTISFTSVLPYGRAENEILHIFLPYLRCQIEYIFNLNRRLNCWKTCLKSAKQNKAGSESRQTVVIYSLKWHCMAFAPTLNDLNIIVFYSHAVKLSCLPQTCLYTTHFSNLCRHFASYFRGLFSHFISRETHGFDESLVIQHKMADFCALIYFLARLKWNIT